MYLCTVLLGDRNMLVRCDWFASGVGTYGVFAADGTISTFDTPADSPDEAIVNLIRDLVWSEVSGAMWVVQTGLYDQQDVDRVLAYTRPFFALTAQMTSSLIQ